MTDVPENYRRILGRIGEAAARSGRSPESIRLLGVTKRVDPGRILEAIDCGLTEIGENRVQEAESKFPLLALKGVTRHLVGHLQSNKSRRAIDLFSVIQSVDRVELAERLDRIAETRLPVLIQMKLGSEETKSGVPEDRLQPLVDAIRASERLELQGLMGIPPYCEDPEQARPYFRQLKRRTTELGLTETSMGMSHDFEVAIEEGATLVRIGTALFGARS